MSRLTFGNGGPKGKICPILTTERQLLFVMLGIAEKKKILIVGCTPPPYHGQAMMIQNLATGKFQKLKLYVVRMSFSGSMTEIGKFSMAKVVHLFEVVARCLYYRWTKGVRTFYYSPGGSTKTPVLRDIVLLFFLRLFFKRTVFHFHSAGTASLVDGLPKMFNKMARFVYRAPDLAIYLSAMNLDNKYFDIASYAIVPNGLQDEAASFPVMDRAPRLDPEILFVGIVKESKGVMVLLEALLRLKEKGYAFRATFMGDFDSVEFKEHALSFCQNHALESIVAFIGSKQGSEKWAFFRRADLLCFPSYYQSESFGNVLIEAMMFSLPVVATIWRGIPDIVDDQINGFLVPILDSNALATSIQKLLDHPELRAKMGANGRAKYLQLYSRPVFLKKMEDLLVSVVD